MPRTDAQKRADAKYDAKRRGTRRHNWNAIGYPESMPPDWLDILRDSPCQGFVSPLHDKDVNADGEPKKPHHHIIISFSNVKTYDDAKGIFDRIGAVMPPKNPAKWQPKPWVEDMRAELRYFLHLDQPSKAQYDISGVQTWGGVDYESLIMTTSDDDEVIYEIMDFCDKYDVASYARLCQYVRKHRPEWRRVVLRSGAVPLSRYLRSVSWQREHGWALAGDNLDELAEDMKLCGGDDMPDSEPPS